MRRLLSILVACGWCLAGTLVAGVGAQAKEKVCLCHAPPGNPGNAHTICVGAPATRAHLRHGDTLGECGIACGGDAGDTCGQNQFCRREAGTCAKGAGGVCATLPSTCPVAVNEVCGCDGKTYLNACLAAAAGVTIDYAGACTVK